ncbi:MAG: transcription antitermination factor NusB [Candidatus Lambdaproteobacteria bacterium]|nr:transcription antitermination factor NusB [Candidatus Lambdaproteobacteria bacterium]
MHGSRRQGRAFALQLLYLFDIHDPLDEAAIERFWAYQSASAHARGFAMQLVLGVREQRERIDAWLQGSMEQWKLSRLSVVVRNILRLAACELLVLGDVPHPVVINEAVELTHKYMDEDSAHFVNSVLEKCWQAQQVTASSAPPPNADGSQG